MSLKLAAFGSDPLSHFNDLDTIVSDSGYGRNDYIPTDKPIVVVTGPGPGSGKFATCLTMLYHEVKKGKQANMAMLARALSVMAKAD